MLRVLKWLGGILVALVLILVIVIATFDWNRLRGPISRMASDKTGRELLIRGDLKVKLGWPLLHISAGQITFANPAWAKEAHMVDVQQVDAALNLPSVFRREFIFPEVKLTNGDVHLEQRGSKKNWLLDLQQQDEKSKVQIGRLMLDQGRLSYDDVEQKTSIQSELSTQTAGADARNANIDFKAQGTYKGMALKARGSGGPVLALRDEKAPYPLNVDATIGRTTIHAKGTITSLTKFSAMDMQLALRGASLAQLYTLFGIALPETPPYTTQGRIVHNTGMWRYEKFSGHIGKSDIAGSLQVDLDGKRPFLHGDLVSQLLDFADLGPIIGAKPSAAAAKNKHAGSKTKAAQTDNAGAAPSQATAAASDVSKSTAQTPASATSAAARPRHVLPDAPFHTERWNSVDADVKLKAKRIQRAQALPIDDLVTHIKMKDSVITLDPLNFGVAGGDLIATVVLNGNKNPIQAHLKMRARKMQLSKLFPTFKLNKASVGQVNGAFDLNGSGNSVAKMLATANGNAALIVADGEVSKLMMEMVGLHLWEILQLKLTGDQTIKINCAVADFNVKQGLMQPNVMLLDTEVTRIDVTGNIDLGQETLDLTLIPKTKKTSLIALRTPIYIRGTLSQPQVSIDKARLALRTLGAVALGAANPLLALVPLVETGPGMNSQCGKLIEEARASAANKK